MKKTILRALLAVIAVAASGAAQATSYSTTSAATINPLAAGAAVYCNAAGCSTTVAGLTGTTPYATLTAWSTPGATAAGAGISPTENNAGTWVQAKIAVYGSGGIGITNLGQTNTIETTSPQHAIDNNGFDDILVVDFGSGGWDVTSFSLGYTCGMNTTGSSCSTTTVAAQAWLGGTNGSSIDFATEVFDANGLAAKPVGFTSLNLTNDPITGNGTIVQPGTVTGRYLVITGALGAGTINGTTVNGYSDSFKVNAIVATKVPVPGSLPLAALGLLALTLVRRRSAVRA